MKSTGTTSPEATNDPLPNLAPNHRNGGSVWLARDAARSRHCIPSAENLERSASRSRLRRGAQRQDVVAVDAYHDCEEPMTEIGYSELIAHLARKRQFLTFLYLRSLCGPKTFHRPGAVLALKGKAQGIIGEFKGRLV